MFARFDKATKKLENSLAFAIAKNLDTAGFISGAVVTDGGAAVVLSVGFDAISFTGGATYDVTGKSGIACHGGSYAPKSASNPANVSDAYFLPFDLDQFETCPRCGGRLRLMALITEPQSVQRFLRHRGEPTEPPARAPPRAPPYFKTLVVRRRQPSDPSTQR